MKRILLGIAPLLSVLLLDCSPAAVAPAAAAKPAPVVFVGVDGMEWSVIEALQTAGKMPNLKALRERGVSAKLATDYEAASPIVWTTVATGTNKEVHGITGFTVTTPTGDAPVSSTMRKVPAIWNMVGRYDRRALVLGWWGSWPAEDIHGVVISDRAAKPVEKGVSPAAYAPLFAKELVQANADRTLFPLDVEAGAEDRMVTWFYEQYAKRNFDVTLGYLHGIDLVSHKYWKYWEPAAFKDVDPALLAEHADQVPGKYRAIDAAIGRIVKAAPPNANVIVISDHGFGPLPEEFYRVSLDLDTVFAELGVVTRVGTGVDLAASKVYCKSPYFATSKSVHFGTNVAEAQKAAVRAEVVAALTTVSYEKGEPVFTVRDAKPYEIKQGADFVVETLTAGATKALIIGGMTKLGAIKDLVHHSGGHAWLPPGVFIAAGPDIDPKADLSGIRIHDIAPTLLVGMGLPIADDFPGKAFTDLFTAEFRAAWPVQRIPTYGTMSDPGATSSQVDTEMVEQLRSLGYIQ